MNAITEGVNQSHVGKTVSFKKDTEKYGTLKKVHDGYAHISVYDSDTGDRNIVLHPANRTDLDESVIIEGHHVSIQYTDWMKLSPDAQAAKHKSYPTLKIIGEPKQAAAKHKSVTGGTDGVRPQDIVLQYDYYKSFDGVPDIDQADVIEAIAKKRNCSTDVALKALNFFAKREGHKNYNDAYDFAMKQFNESVVKEEAACTSTSAAPHMGVPGESGGKKPPKDKLARRKTQMESYKVGDRVTILSEGNRIGRIVAIVEDDGSYIVDPNSVLHRGVKLDNMNLGAAEIEPFVDVKSILENLKATFIAEVKGENPFAKKDNDEDDDKKDDAKDDKKDDDKKCDKCDGKLDDDGDCPKCDDDDDKDTDDEEKKVAEAFYSSPAARDAARASFRASISGKKDPEEEKKKKGTPDIKKESVLVELDVFDELNETAIKKVAIRLSMNTDLSMAESFDFVRGIASDLVLDEDVRFNTSTYYGSHRKEPRGTGNWMISHKRDLDFSKDKKDVDYIQHNGTLSSAKAVAAKHAKANGHTEMHILP